MVVVGVVLLLLALIFGADVVWQNHVHIPTVTVFGFNLGVGNSAALFVVGAITGAAIVLGVVLLVAGGGLKGTRAVRNRRRPPGP